jgi:RHS repeat-associated protein
VAGSTVISHTYDARNRLLSTSHGDGSQNITRSYTPDGMLSTIGITGTGLNPITWAYSYDNRRLLTQERYTWGDPNYGWDFVWQRDAYGHVVSLTDPSGTLHYAPDALGRPTQVSGYASGVRYHPDGAVAGYTLGNGITHVMTPNLRGLPEVMQHGGVVRDRYTYDANGNVTAIADETTGGVNSRSMTLYDGLDRLQQASGPWGAASFSYDTLDNLTGSTVGVRSLTHHIDPTTNRLVGFSGSLSLGMAYDANGNVVQRGGQGFTFDIGNRMTRAAGKASYVYDGHGRRNLVWFDGGGYMHQAYTQDGKLRFAWHSSQGGRRHVYLGDRLIAETTEGGVTTYVHTDGLGSPVAKTSNTGALVERTRYEPYGATVAMVDRVNPTTIGYTGHVNDADTGLVYMQQRYYDPVAGRFLTVDPVPTDANTGGHFSRYDYVSNNPFKFIDPDGRAKSLGGGFGFGWEEVSNFADTTITGGYGLQFKEAAKAGNYGEAGLKFTAGVAYGILNVGTLGKGAAVVAAASKGLTFAAKGAAAHSVAFETTIAKAGVGTRGSHFTDANSSLAAAMNKDPAFAKMMDGLGVKIPQRLDQSPAGWSWHHVPNQPGTLQLVPRAQHQGGPWQPLLHPNQTGGFKLWGADY